MDTNRIKNFLFYAGLTKEEYEEIQEIYLAPNSAVLRIVSLCCGVLTVLFGVFYKITMPTEHKEIFYFVIGFINIVVAYFAWGKARGNYKIEKLLSNIFILSFYLLGIYTGTAGIPDKLAVLYIVALVVSPMVFNDRPIMLLSEMLCTVALFSVLALEYKEPAVAYVDIADAIVFAIVSVVLSSFLYKTKATGYLAEYRTRQNEEELKKALKAAEEANRAKSEFLSNMSHDIRTPMNAIIDYSNLIKKELTDPKLLDYQQKIESSSNLLLSIINHVLDMSHIDSGKTKIEEQYARISDIPTNIVNVFGEEARKKDISLEYEVNIYHDYILSDLTKLNEIYINIVSNAIKYTPSGGHIKGVIEEIPSDREGYAMIRTIISDTGIGISPEYLPHIFDSFSRERNSTVSGIQGTGLGMSIVKKLVDLLEGTITVESEVGKGSTFTVTLPHKIVDESKVNINTIEENVDSKELLKGKHILMAEDNDLNAEIAIAILEEAGLTIDRVEDGLKCVERIKEADKNAYDLILMDIQMPNMNGYEASKAIRALNDDRANIPIIAMTANAFEEDKKNAYDAGMNGHVSKPIDIEKLLSVLSEKLNKTS
ncbi:MAG: ATP-binding protein [Erysipelotrichaceae bacterium]|nr:ATP-binding protein [Erysipelotrichaceae bacterium]